MFQVYFLLCYDYVLTNARALHSHSPCLLTFLSLLRAEIALQKSVRLLFVLTFSPLCGFFQRRRRRRNFRELQQ